MAKSLNEHLAARLTELVGPDKPISEVKLGKKSLVSPRTIAAYKRLQADDPGGGSLTKIQRIADAMKIDPLLLLSDLGPSALALARAFQAFEHPGKPEVYRYLLNVLEGRATLVLPAVQTWPELESRPMREPYKHL